MGLLKKPVFWVIAIAVIACAAAVVFILFNPGDKTKNAETSPETDALGEIIYHYGDISFEETLTVEETDALREIIQGKRAYSGYIYGVPACGFDRNIAFILDGKRYSVACDTCGTLQTGAGFRFMHLSDEEISVIHEMFERRGGKFPCV